MSTQQAAVDVHEVLRLAEEQRMARADQLPDAQNCIRMMVQVRLRLEELGWRSADYAPKDGIYFDAIVAGYAGPSRCCWLGNGFFIADGGDFWPCKPMMFLPTPDASS